MLQDLEFGRLENEYRNVEATGKDTLFCFGGGKILIRRNGDNTLELPLVEQVLPRSEKWEKWNDRPLQYLFRMHGVNYFLWMGQAGEFEGAFSYETVRTLRQTVSKEVCFAAMTAWHLYVWYRNSRFCGSCGAKTIHDGKERMMRCPECGNMIFPRISPAVIVGVTNGDKLLLSKYAGRNYAHFAMIAGFTEIGETLEQTLEREVMEEVGLRVKNIRYYKSQPWGVDGNVLMGFYCDVDGDDTIHIDETELSVAQWHLRSEIPAKDDGISLTREMIRVFEEGREPK